MDDEADSKERKSVKINTEERRIMISYKQYF
jgi:hypothetical protein